MPLFVSFDNFLEQGWLISDEPLSRHPLTLVGVWHLCLLFFVELSVELLTLVVIQRVLRLFGVAGPIQGYSGTVARYPLFLGQKALGAILVHWILAQRQRLRVLFVNFLCVRLEPKFLQDHHLLDHVIALWEFTVGVLTAREVLVRVAVLVQSRLLLKGHLKLIDKESIFILY